MSPQPTARKHECVTQTMKPYRPLLASSTAKNSECTKLTKNAAKCTSLVKCFKTQRIQWAVVAAVKYDIELLSLWNCDIVTVTRVTNRKNDGSLDSPTRASQFSFLLFGMYDIHFPTSYMNFIPVYEQLESSIRLSL